MCPPLTLTAPAGGALQHPLVWASTTLEAPRFIDLNSTASFIQDYNETFWGKKYGKREGKTFGESRYNRGER